MMKVLWLSPANTLFNEKGDRTYNGKGWVASLQDAVAASGADIRLAVAFLSKDGPSKTVRDGVTYYSIRRRSPSGFRKLYCNWTGAHPVNYDAGIRKVAEDFGPDVIHIFGCETPLASAILSIPEIPSAIHIQGIISEYTDGFFPDGMTWRDCITVRTFFNEAVLRNGYIHMHEDFLSRAVLERRYLNSLKFAMGRTDWDRETLKKYSDAAYFHVDEVLREEFYSAAGQFRPRKAHGTRQIHLISTVSPVPYKGIDLILRTASILTGDGYDVIWDVIGAGPDSGIVRISEKVTGIRAGECGVRFRGVLDARNLVRLMLDADIYVHPSYFENSSNSICEAQMLGMPVIASDTGGTPSIVDDGISGLLFRTGDAAKAAEAVKSLWSDPETAAAAGMAGAAGAAGRHDKAKIVRDLLSAYRDIYGSR